MWLLIGLAGLAGCCPLVSAGNAHWPQFLAKFDLEDGRELWRTSRHEVATWSTPGVVTTGGRPQIVVNGWQTIGSYDFHSGQPIWWLSGGGDAPIPTPVAAHGPVYLTSAHGRWRPMRAVRLDATAHITPAIANGQLPFRTRSHLISIAESSRHR